MTEQSLNDKPPERLTVDEWLDRCNELGYYITQPRIIYEEKGWKSVATFAAILLMLGLVMGGILGGIEIGGKYYSCKEPHHGR